MANVNHASMPAPSGDLERLSILGWSQIRIPTPKERDYIQNLISQDERTTRSLKNELERLKLLTERRQKVMKRYSDAVQVATSLRSVCILRINALVVARRKLAPLDAITASTSTTDAPYDEASEIFNEVIECGSAVKQQLSTQLHELEAELLVLEKKIPECEHVLIAERTYLSTLAACTERLSSLLSQYTKDMEKKQDILRARRRIPVEIWRQIFLVNMEQEEASLERGYRRGKPPFTAFKLGSVCQFWRDIVESYPAIWQPIAIPHHDYISLAQKDRIRHCAARLGNLLPRAYTYDNAFYTPDKGKACFRFHLLDFLQLTFKRYEAFEVIDKWFSLLRGPSMTHFLRELAPVTRRLTVHPHPYSIRSGIRSQVPYEVLEETEILQGVGVSLAISHNFLPRSLLQRTVSNLRTLMVTNSNWRSEDMQTCLSAADKVESLYIINTSILKSHGTTHTTVPSLKTLECPIREYVTLQDVVRMPKLRSLKLFIQHPFDIGAWSITKEHAPGIRELTITASTLQGTALIAEDINIAILALQAFKEIESLTISGYRLRGCLSLLPTDDIPLSRLTRLTIVDCRVSDTVLKKFRSAMKAKHQRDVEIIIQ